MSDMITEFAAGRQGTTLLDPFLRTGADRMNLRPPLSWLLPLFALISLVGGFNAWARAGLPMVNPQR